MQQWQIERWVLSWAVGKRKPLPCRSTALSSALAPVATKILRGDISLELQAVFRNRLYVSSIVMLLLVAMHLLALFAQGNDNSVGVTRWPNISLVFAVNRVYCYYPSPSVVHPSALENRAVHRETEAMAEEEKKESDYEYPKRETTTEEKPSKDEYPVREMIRWRKTRLKMSIYPEAETKAEKKSEDEYLKTEEAEASKFWDIKHEKDFDGSEYCSSNRWIISYR